MRKKYFCNKAFSLTEISVTIIIIGLLVGAILQGTAMLESARLQTIISDISNFKVSVNSFKAKYNQYPGDFNKAEFNWSNATSTVSDGDNNGQISFRIEESPAVFVYEGYGAWQHLTYAGMIDSQFLGQETTSAATVGVDVPKSFNNGGYFFEYAHLNIFDSNVIVLGTPIAIATTENFSANGTLAPFQAHDIDMKMDDGVGDSGSVRSADGSGSVANSCVNSGTYSLSLEGKDCIMAFKISQ